MQCKTVNWDDATVDISIIYGTGYKDINRNYGVSVSQLSLHNEKYNSCDRKLFVCYEA